MVASLQALDVQSCWNWVPEIARDVLSEMSITENLGTLSVEKIIEIQQEIWDRKQTQRGTSENIIEDRHPLLDVYAYSCYWLARHKTAGEFLEKLRFAVDEGAKKSKKDEFILVVPPNIPLVDDGVRAEAPHFRDTIHTLILGTLTRYQYDYQVLTEDTITGRLREALFAIEDRKEWLK